MLCCWCCSGYWYYKEGEEDKANLRCDSLWCREDYASHFEWNLTLPLPATKWKVWLLSVYPVGKSILPRLAGETCLLEGVWTGLEINIDHYEGKRFLTFIDCERSRFAIWKLIPPKRMGFLQSSSAFDTSVKLISTHTTCWLWRGMNWTRRVWSLTWFFWNRNIFDEQDFGWNQMLPSLSKHTIFFKSNKLYFDIQNENIKRAEISREIKCVIICQICYIN